jgi:hypothetical protein
MSSTKNINCINDYNIKKKQNNNILDYNLYLGKGAHNNPQFIYLGSNPKFRKNTMSHNSTDIESMLLGINSTNLEYKSFSTVPQFKELGNTEFFVKPNKVKESNIIIENNNRPLFLS